ncbi:MAG TPA: carbon monoxide dehydrogenase subunit G [Pyrinomonadaceae bacterium]|nr:carbon monoxide dehydrogenase subunit G [Pyrinomonadaceae bacterium]
MKIEGTQTLHATRQRVYSALTDPRILQRCIPGCESLEKTAENTYAATLKAGVGAIKGSFKGEVRLEDMRPPEHYRIVVEGKGAVGFARGSADFDLEEMDGNTLIKYSGELQIGGTIAGVGQRMIVAAAKMMASRFFAALEAEVSVDLDTNVP